MRRSEDDVAVADSLVDAVASAAASTASVDDDARMTTTAATAMMRFRRQWYLRIINYKLFRECLLFRNRGVVLRQCSKQSGD